MTVPTHPISRPLPPMATDAARFSSAAADPKPKIAGNSEYLLTSATAPDTQTAPVSATKDGKGDEAGASFSFHDLLSVINPLQHIPIVGTIYRRLTGDTIGAPAKIIGGALFGGPAGFLTSIADAVFTQATGKDLGAQALALVFPEKNEQRDPSDPQPQLMANAAPATARTGAIAGGSSAPLAQDTAPTASEAVASAPVSGVSAGDELSAAPARLFPRIASAAPAGQNGKTLAQYQNFAGQRMPVIDATRSANGGVSGARSAPVPLQTTLPLVADRVRTPAVPPAPANDMVAAQLASTGDTHSGGGAGAEKDDWIAAAMMRGLDRYREMKRQQENLPRRVDTAI